MDLSKRWLSDYVDLGDISPKEFSEAITMTGSKVESYEYEGSGIENVIVGKIIE